MADEPPKILPFKPSAKPPPTFVCCFCDSELEEDELKFVNRHDTVALCAPCLVGLYNVLVQQQQFQASKGNDNGKG